MAVADDNILAVFSEILSEKHPSFAVKLGDRQIFYLGDGSPLFTLKIQNKKALIFLLLKPDAYRLGALFVNKEIDIDQNLYSALRLKDYIKNARVGFRRKATLAWRVLTI